MDTTLDLPEFLDPVLDYLSTVLPQPIYSTLEYLLAHVYALLSALLALLLTLSKSIIDVKEGSLQERIEHWWDSLDAQEILPPLITLFAAYLALLSFYRTSKWMIRTVFAFVKWGFILTTLGTAAGYYIANAHVGGAEGANGMGRWGFTQVVGGLVNEFLDGHAQRAGSKSRPNTRSKTRKEKTKARPKVYESWDKQQEWQYSETAGQHNGQENGFAEVQKVIGSILGGIGEGSWWQTFVAGGNEGERETRRERRERGNQSK